MAQTYSFWSATTMKLMLLAMVSVGALAGKAGRGRFLASLDDAAPIRTPRRQLMSSVAPINDCGTGTSDECQQIFRLVYRSPKCCKDTSGNSACWDTAILWDKCGSCTKKCAFGQICCDGVCANLESDPNNCGSCGIRCSSGVACVKFTCGYNGKHI